MLGLRAEVISFLTAFLTGMTVACIYWCLRKLRRVIRHSLMMIAAEDAAYWIGVAVYVFVQIYYTSSGSIRWYFVIGTIMGVLIFLLSGKLLRKMGRGLDGKREKKSGKTIEIKKKRR